MLNYTQKRKSLNFLTCEGNALKRQWKKTVGKGIKTIALKKKRLKKGLKKEKNSKRRLQGWNTSPCVAT